MSEITKDTGRLGQLSFRAGIVLWLLVLLCFAYNAGRNSALETQPSQKKLICQSKPIATDNSLLSRPQPAWQARYSRDAAVGALEGDVNCSRLNGHGDMQNLLQNAPKGYETQYRLAY